MAIVMVTKTVRKKYQLIFVITRRNMLTLDCQVEHYGQKIMKQTIIIKQCIWRTTKLKIINSLRKNNGTNCLKYVNGMEILVAQACLSTELYALVLMGIV